MKNVLLIAGLDQQYYYNPFIQACEGKGLAIYIFDPSRFPAEVALNVAMDNEGKITGFIDVQENFAGTLKNSRLSVTDINIAWHLRENLAQSDSGKDSLAVRFTKNESRIALRAFFSTLDCVWVNHRDAMDRLSSNKFYQQLVARQCGLSIPQTLISNDPQSVEDFSHPEEGLLLKSLGCIKLDEERRYFLYASRFTHGELAENATAIRKCPIFSQKYVEKRFEYRVMVIGKRILSCRIDSQASEATKTDWRHYDFEHVKHSCAELPQDVQKKLLLFMQKVGLRYGAIDLIETPKGDFVFLEVNPSGQWGWIADLAGLQIPEAVAEMLQSL